VEAFVVVTHFGGLVYGPFAHYEDADVAAKHAEPSSGHPLKIEKYFLCYQQDGSFCVECIRVLTERGSKAEAAFKMGAKLGISFKPHA
jgi:hypothetical protein